MGSHYVKGKSSLKKGKPRSDMYLGKSVQQQQKEPKKGEVTGLQIIIITVLARGKDFNHDSSMGKEKDARYYLGRIYRIWHFPENLYIHD